MADNLTYDELKMTVAKFEKENIELNSRLQKMKESDKRFNDIAQNTPGWIWEIDANGRYTYSSPLVERILGYSKEEILEKHFYDSFHPDEREKSKIAAYKVIEQKSIFRDFININIRKDGKEVLLLTSGVPIFDENRNFVGYRGTDIDITDLHRAKQSAQRNEAHHPSPL